MRIRIIFLVLCLITAAACASRAVPPPSASSARSRSFEQALERGCLLLAHGEYQKAETEFRAALGADPDSARARNWLGLCYFHEKRYEQAKEQFERATAADPSFAAAYNNLAGVYFVKSKFAESENFYKKALTLSPDLISAHYSLGTLLCNLGRVAEGSEYLARGIALDPEYLDKHAELVTAFSSLSFDLRQTYFAFARAFAAQGNVEKTVEYLEKAQEAGFLDWGRIAREAEFEKVRDDPRVKIFIKIQQPA
jgi:tetratricopeptide (TPR) repeat protein